MSKKKEIEKEIEECELEIKSLEQKLMRSQTVIPFWYTAKAILPNTNSKKK